jgi:hypothetical protein
MRERYFQERNGRDIRNDAAARFIPALKEELARLLQDPDLARLHGNCVAHHKARIAALKDHPEFADIWKAIRNEVALPLLADASRSAAE